MMSIAIIFSCFAAFSILLVIASKLYRKKNFRSNIIGQANELSQSNSTITKRKIFINSEDQLTIDQYNTLMNAIDNLNKQSDHLEKPYNKKELENMIDDLVESMKTANKLKN